MTGRQATRSVTIITINFNTGTEVRRTIGSVLAQDHPFTWVVVDGASGDESLPSLRAAMRPGDVLISERDRGISDAFNKGVRAACGDAVIFMNAGDEFASAGALSAVMAHWDVSARWITGGAQVVGVRGEDLYTRASGGLTPRDLVSQGCRIFHQSTLVERSLFSEFGPFRDDFRTSMDYELWLRWMSRGVMPCISDTVVSRFRIGGASGNVMRRLAEERRARRMHGCRLPPLQESRLWLIAAVKRAARSAAGPWAYRFKERLGW